MLSRQKLLHTVVFFGAVRRVLGSLLSEEERREGLSCQVFCWSGLPRGLAPTKKIDYFVRALLIVVVLVVVCASLAAVVSLQQQEKPWRPF